MNTVTDDDFEDLDEYMADIGKDVLAKLAGDDFTAAFGFDGDVDAELAELRAHLQDEGLGDVDVRFAGRSSIGRGAEGDVLLVVFGLPFTAALAALGKTVVTDPEKLAASYRFYADKMKKLGRLLSGADQISRRWLQDLALAQFVSDHPNGVPDFRRITVVAHAGDVPETGWGLAEQTLVIIPDSTTGLTTIYVMGTDGAILETLRTATVDESVHDPETFRPLEDFRPRDPD